MALRLDTYYEEVKDLSLEELENKYNEIEKWLSSDERKEFEKHEINKSLDEQIDVDNPIEIANSKLKVLGRLIHDKSVGDGSPYLDYFKELNGEQESLKCPICGSDLMFMEPGSILYCNNCNKYFESDYKTVGKEIKKPEYDESNFY